MHVFTPSIFLLIFTPSSRLWCFVQTSISFCSLPLWHVGESGGGIVSSANNSNCPFFSKPYPFYFFKCTYRVASYYWALHSIVFCFVFQLIFLAWPTPVECFIVLVTPGILASFRITVKLHISPLFITVAVYFGEIIHC